MEQEDSRSAALVHLPHGGHEIRNKHKLLAVLHYVGAPLAFLFTLLRQTDSSVSRPPTKHRQDAHGALSVPALPRAGGTARPSRSARSRPGREPTESRQREAPTDPSGSPAPGRGCPLPSA